MNPHGAQAVPGVALRLLVIAGLVSAAACTAPNVTPPPSVAKPSFPAATCSCIEETPTPPGGITRADAIARARAAVPIIGVTPPTVVWASVTANPFQEGLHPDPVWLVRLQGSIAAPSCPPDLGDRVPSPSSPACLDIDQGVDVALDLYSGAVIGYSN